MANLLLSSSVLKCRNNQFRVAGFSRQRLAIGNNIREANQIRWSIDSDKEFRVAI
jgi:hypothetical protein